MQHNRKFHIGNGSLAVAALIALGVGLVFAQDSPTSPSQPETTPQADATEDPSKKTPSDQRARTPAAGTTPATNGPPGAQNTQTRRRTGVGFQFDTRGGQGLRLSGLVANSAATKAGFRANDRIVSVDGRTFSTQVQLRAYLAAQDGRRVPVIVERDGQRYTIELPTEEDADDGAWLGVNLEEESPADNAAATRGARIVRTFPSGPAAQAGLDAGDVIVTINNKPISGPSDVITIVQDLQPNAQAEFGILHENESTVTKLPVVLGDRSSYLGQRHAGSRGQPQGQNAGSQGQPGQNPATQGAGQVNQSGDDDIPPFAMQMEHERRMAEQHERIEDEIRILRDEVKKLREMLEKK